MDRLFIFDTTLRDGEQSPGASMTKDEKVRIARQLERLRVDVIEAGFPAASPGDFDAVRAVAGSIGDATVAGLCRANEQDISLAVDALNLQARAATSTIPTPSIRLPVFVFIFDSLLIYPSGKQGVMLLHNPLKRDADALFSLIQQLRHRNIRFCSVNDLVQLFDQIDRVPVGLIRFQFCSVSRAADRDRMFFLTKRLGTIQPGMNDK